MGGFAFLVLFGIFTALFVAPLILGFYVVGQRGGVRALQMYIGFIFLTVLGAMILGTIAVVANWDQSQQFLAAVQLR